MVQTLKLTTLISCICLFTAGCGVSHSNHKYPKYSNEEWLQMLHQRQYQPVLSWRGISRGSLRNNGASMGINGMQVDNPPAYGMSQDLTQNLEKTPLFLLPLMGKHENSDIAFTGLYVYEYILPDDLKRQYKNEISGAFRGLLSHRDSSVRATALSYLQRNRWLRYEDIELTIKDNSASVAYLAFSGADVMLEEQREQIVYDENGKRVAGSDQVLKDNIELKRKLVPLMLDHLNDAHFYIRSISAGICRRSVRRWVKTERGRTEKNPPNYPEYFDWMRASYAERVEKQKEWKQWWADYGEECLRFTYPDL